MIVSSSSLEGKKISSVLVAAFLTFLFVTPLAYAAPLTFSVIDPVGDNTGPIDVTQMDFSFDNSSGAYAINLTSTAGSPFLDVFRVNINLFNQDLGTTAPNPSFFADVFNDFDLSVPTTTLMLSGVNMRLLSWNAGNRVFTNSLAGTGNPAGTTLFRSTVDGPPIGGFLTSEDYIAFASDGQPAIIDTPSNPIPEPSTMLLLGPGVAGLIAWKRKISRA